MTEVLTKLLARKKVIIFDFDGVIVNSMSIKAAAFAEIYKDHGGTVVRKVVSHHFENGGMSRYDKFKHYHETYLKRQLKPSELEKLSIECSKAVTKEIIYCPSVLGVMDFLDGFCKDKSCYVNSATPQAEIEQILDARGLTTRFKKIFGSPDSKVNNLRKIICENSENDVADFVFFGDALSDLEASKMCSVDFIGVALEKETSSLIDSLNHVFLIQDFRFLNQELS